MEFIMGIGMGIFGVAMIVVLIMCIEENKKTNTLVNKIKRDTTKIIHRQELIMNEIGVDLNKQRQS